MAKTLGYIYVIGSYEHLTHVKVGLSKYAPHNRLKDLQTGNPFTLQLWGSFAVTRGSLIECEKIIHGELIEFHFRNEWFKRHPRDMLKHVDDAVSRYNNIKK